MSGVWRRRIAVSLAAIYLVAALPAASQRAWVALRNLIALRGESFDQSRIRAFGADYTAGIEAARAAIPFDSEYLLFDGGTVEEGALNWVRYDLAPRRAVSGGRVARLGRPERVREKLRRAPALVVVARPGVAPLVMTHEEFFAWLESGAAGG